MKTREWIEAAEENFRSALSEGYAAIAKAIIADAFDAGFPEEARSMADRLEDANLTPES